MIEIEERIYNLKTFEKIFMANYGIVDLES